MALHFNKRHTQLLTEQEAVTKALQDIVNTPTVQVMVDGIRPLPDDWYVSICCMQIISVARLKYVILNDYYTVIK